MPGKALFWSHHDVELVQNDKTTHVTKSVTGTHINEFLSKNSKTYEALAILKLSAAAVSLQSVNEAFHNSKSKVAFVNVYQDKAQPSASAISDSVGVPQKMTMKEFQDKCSSKSVMMTNGFMDIIEVSVESEEELKSAAASSNGNVLMAVYQEPTVDSFVPDSHPQGTARKLSDNISDGKFYKPEGAEYSIYYADTYLYITPDIFTGLLTGLFFFFTILIGVSCLGKIQGMTTFYDKVPPVGKEA